LNFYPKLYSARLYLRLSGAEFRLTIWFNGSKLKGLIGGSDPSTTLLEVALASLLREVG